MEKTIKMRWNRDTILFSDLDVFHNIVITTECEGREMTEFLTTPENILALKQHIDYLVGKLDDIGYRV